MNTLLKYKEQISYLIFGVLTTAVNFVVYFALRKINIPYEISNALAIAISILFAYVTNKIWVFSSKTETFAELLKEFIKFISLRFVSALIDMLSMVVLIDFIKTGDLIAKIATAFIVVVLNYIFSKVFIFKKGE